MEQLLLANKRFHDFVFSKGAHKSPKSFKIENYDTSKEAEPLSALEAVWGFIGLSLKIIFNCFPDTIRAFLLPVIRTATTALISYIEAFKAHKVFKRTRFSLEISNACK